MIEQTSWNSQQTTQMSILQAAMHVLQYTHLNGLYDIK